PSALFPTRRSSDLVLISLRELLDQIVGSCRLGFEFAGALLKPRNLFLGRRRPAHEPRDAGVYISQLFLKAVCLGGRLLLRTFERLARLLKFCQCLLVSSCADTSGQQRSTYDYCCNCADLHGSPPWWP